MDVHWCRRCSTRKRIIRGLTVHQPWAWAITARIRDPKRLENRSKPPPRKMIGQFLAIHAGLSTDVTATDRLRAAGLDLPLWHELEVGVVLGVARLIGWVAPGGPQLSRWHDTEQYAWMLDQVVPLGAAVPARGYQGLWRLDREDPGLLAAVRSAWRAGRAV